MKRDFKATKSIFHISWSSKKIQKQPILDRIYLQYPKVNSSLLIFFLKIFQDFYNIPTVKNTSGWLLLDSKIQHSKILEKYVRFVVLLRLTLIIVFGEVTNLRRSFKSRGWFRASSYDNVTAIFAQPHLNVIPLL